MTRILGLQPSNVSTTVRRLVDRGLLESVWVDAVRARLTTMTDEQVDLLVKAAPLFAALGSMV